MVPDKTGRVKPAFFAGRALNSAPTANKINQLPSGTTLALKAAREPACVLGSREGK
jgi:hypothetical protein